MDRIKLAVKRRLDFRLIENNAAIKRIFDPHKSVKYSLRNEMKNHALTIEPSGDGFIIDGSWRKWHLGNNSLEDLSSSMIEPICAKIAQHLGIETDDIYCRGRIRIMEYGFVFPLSVYADTILRKAYKYSSAKPIRYDTSTVFKLKGMGYWLSMYDKVEEINSGRNKVDPSSIDYHYLRIEIKAYKYSSLVKKLRGVETLKDVKEEYHMLAVSLLKEIKKIDIEPIILNLEDVDFHDKGVIDLKRYIFCRGVVATGGMIQYRKLLKQTKTAKGGKSVQLKKMSLALKEYQDNKLYQKSDFIREIQEHTKHKIRESLLSRG